MTTTWRMAAVGAAAMVAAAVVAGAACGKARNTGGSNGGSNNGGPAASVTEQVVNPYGFTLQITAIEIPADPTSAATPPTVTFTLKDETGAPITDLGDELGKAPNTSTTPPTPASGYPYINAPRFTLARLDPDGTYVAQYTTGTGGTTMATSVTLPRDPTQFAAKVTSNGNGSYTFRLNPLAANPSSDERSRTWTAGAWASRRPSAQTPADEAASSTGNFVPAGGTATTKQVVSLAACNTCHGPAVRAHGTRLGVQLCLTCHTAQTHDPKGTSVEFVELIHKIHYGADRPGPTYTIVGFQNSENTFDDEWINDVRNCTLCHQGANADRHFTAPSQRACTTCHSVVHFDGTAAATCATGKKDTADCNHQAGPQPDTACAGCHSTSQLGTAHTSIFTVAQGWKYEIKSATVGADRKPTVTFDVIDTSNNQARDLNADASYTDPSASLNVQLGWPSKDYNNAGGSTTAPGQPRSIAIVRGGHFNPTGSNVTPVAGQTNVYQVTSPVALPDGVTSYTVFMDGHPVARGENIPVTNAVQTFGVAGGAGDARRTVVSVQNCNVCHGTLSWHGRNRNGSVETCVVCHNPHATDWQKRQGVTPAPAGPESPVDFKYLIHAVHSADIRHAPLTVYEFNAANASTGGAPGKPEDFPGTIPHGVANCAICHVNTSYEPPLSADAQDTTIDTKGTPADQTDDVTMPKTMAVCTSCHDQTQFAQQTPALPGCSTLTAPNSAPCLHSGGSQTGDASCATCHGRGGLADVTTVHGVH